ncbi:MULTISPECIES: ATP-binding protein [Idiomarina]|jgi:C4-dicarboxylate-specific signal transduction histidine kinase|uniref:histidine kinase n=1 Tax=Idiomarina abyssalis TaxID=86102 RepID=A0A8I1KE90_9GAMM|nr:MULTISPECIES: ATP-binding protein [Idiomarina]MAO68595.1 HAMP domain-containing histidine kinase [Idiomarina sp.]MBF81256.1 HAMP domain-containing histidine kinase [Idiomarina sp.]MBH94336.1 HAMP domain-containing histidine kinase [Idiomarina sp.]MBJ7265812.1 HAMP domain-containing protein [Idiomarina abyssalis]MBJ7273968.1 HAMP domain-containing protein [Idiomarina abyssalis]|tara:strand:+ start:192 stop:1811 length:1620 start_codon:yes stop_codon:yes gene_type:complete
MHTISLKRILIYIVLLVTSFALLVGFTVNIVSQVAQYEKSLHEQSLSYARIVAGNAASSLVFNDNATEKQRLNSLQNTDFIQHVHVYKLDETSNELTFFSSYNKQGLAPIPARFSKLDRLTSPQIQDNYIEVSQPVVLDSEVIGYVYLRGSLEQARLFMWRSIGIAAVVFVLTLLLCWLVTLRLRKTIVTPLDSVVDVISQVARDKNYSLRLAPSQLVEFDMMAHAFNTMLDRVQQHISRQRRAEEEASQLNTELERQVTQRTQALKESNSELLKTLEQLHQYQGQLVESEKMASLGDMVAGIAHEVNTPIGLSVTASTLLQDKLTVMQEKFDEKRISTSEFERFLSDCDENLQIIYRNLGRAADLVTSFKQVAVDQSSEVDRDIHIPSFMNDVLISVKPRRLDPEKFPIRISCPDNLTVRAKAGPLNQVLINLIVNSMIHAFDGYDHGQIDISFSMQNDSELEMVYADNGKGVPSDISRKIFDPFVTTKRGSGGSGLGLHLVYNLVTQVLGGNIHFFSEEKNGVEFIVRFPVTLVSNA